MKTLIILAMLLPSMAFAGDYSKFNKSLNEVLQDEDSLELNDNYYDLNKLVGDIKKDSPSRTKGRAPASVEKENNPSQVTDW